MKTPMQELEAQGYHMQFQNGLLEKQHALYALARVWLQLDRRCREMHAGLQAREYWAVRQAQMIVTQHFNALHKSTHIIDITDEGGEL